MKRTVIPVTVAVVVICGMALIGFNVNRNRPSGPPDESAAGAAVVEEPREVKLADCTAEGVELVFCPPGGKADSLEVQLFDHAGKMLAMATQANVGRTARVRLSAAIDPKDLTKYYVQFRTSAGAEFQKRSLYFLREILETTVLGHRDLMAGTRPVVRVMVRDRAIDRPVRGAKVTLTLKENDKELTHREGLTDARGELTAALDLPEREIRDARLTVEVKSETAADRVEETLHIAGATRTLLSTDKPLYQPGQTIHIRALSLSRPTMAPQADAEALFEVEDAKGNKVFKQACRTDRFGISHADFVLADELNKGTYRVRAVVAGTKEEKTVTVDRYVLPKFKIDIKTDRDFYQPGETVKVDLQADYFFGKPVGGGKVQVQCAKFDVAYSNFQTVDGQTDGQGHYSFEVKLPGHFVGQPLEAGKASAKLDVTLTDTADHAEKVTRNVTVTASPILVTAVPESGALIGGLENRIYVVTTYADSTPAKCHVAWSNAPGGKTVTVETDDGGFGLLTLVPEAGKNVAMSLEAKDAKGSAGRASVTLEAAQAKDDRVLVRTDRSLYKVGDALAVSAISTRQAGALYVDLIKDRQTYLTRTLDLKEGRADTKIALSAGLSGTIQVNAYLIGANGVIVRDRRLIIVDPANDLRVGITNAQDTYLPGGEAKISFAVTDPGGRGVASALGVMVVDEAVFALQEMQPGLEKIYFYLEKEIATPRYEIHGYSLAECFTPRPVGAPDPTLTRKPERRDTAARVLLASAKGAGEYTLHVNTYQRDNRGQEFQQKVQPLFADRIQKVQQGLAKYGEAHRKDETKPAKGVSLNELVKEGFLKAQDILDPWGNKMKISGNWEPQAIMYYGFTLASPGVDGKEGTADDVTVAQPYARRFGFARAARQGGGGGPDMEFAEGMPMPMAAAAGPPAERDRLADNAGAKFKGDGEGKSAGGGAEPPRIRKFFPETLYFNPAVITDPDGRATLTIPLADSITTWRMTCMASSGQGQLGSTTAGLRVFQDFFVDIDFPVTLTQNDQVSVPVVVYNYLKTDQTVRLKVERADWFELSGPDELTLKLGPSEVRSVHVPVTVRKVGYGRFTVTGRGANRADAIERTVEVVPDGKEHLICHSGRLDKDVSCPIDIPDGAIDDASKIFVKVYPGTLSQVIEGLDSMLRMPGGCFEQTSSATYPNILVMDYMKTTGKITPEVQMKAEGFINAGYQRLLSFEVRGGGFEWFGNPPAHRILTAYGLMEFHDMSKVHAVDPAVIARTQQWLARLQEGDGSYKPDASGIAEGAINKFTDDARRTTAYITWALASTGYQGDQVEKGLAYLRKSLDDIKDTYTLALTANAFATVEPKGKTTLAVLQALLDRKTEEGDVTYWKATSQTPTHGRGNCADIEVTGLAVQALVRCDQDIQTVSKAVTYLARNKDAYGTWQSTQATIQALRAMLMAERDATKVAEAQIKVAFNGKPVKTIRVDKGNCDVMQLVDLKDLTRKGGNKVELAFQGKGSLLYQVVGRYYLPAAKAPAAADEPLTIKVDYDRTALATEDILGASATVQWNRPGSAQMIIVDLGLPPGFTLMPDNLNTLVADKTIEKYSVTGRQIIVYLRELSAGKPVTIQYQLLAKFPLKAKTAKSVVYEYYNPNSRAETAPVQLTVSGK